MILPQDMVLDSERATVSVVGMYLSNLQKDFIGLIFSFFALIKLLLFFRQRDFYVSYSISQMVKHLWFDICSE